MSSDNGVVPATTQNRPLAKKALYIRTHLAVLLSEVGEWEELVKKQSPHLTSDEVNWLNRIADNLRSRVKPSVDNFEQARHTLDKDKGGKGQ